MVRLMAVMLLAVIGITSGMMLHVHAMEQNIVVNYNGSSEKAAEAEPIDRSQLLSVSPGDTLWTIAKNYGPDDVSVKKYVQLIIEENQLTSANLQVGQVLKLP